MSTGINIILDGAPDQEAGRFVEVENDEGQSVSIGEWTERDGGYWGLRIEMDSERLRFENKKLEAQIEAVRWHIPDPDNPPLDSNLLIQVDLSDGSIDEAYVYLSDDDCDTLHIAGDDYGDVYSDWQWGDVCRYFKTKALEQKEQS